MELTSLIKPLSKWHSTSEKLKFYVSTGYKFLKAPVDVATELCQQSAYETHAGKLDGALEMQMILLMISYVRLVAGLHVQAREPHEHW